MTLALLLGAAYVAIAFGVAVGIGRSIRLADRYAAPCEDAPEMGDAA